MADLMKCAVQLAPGLIEVQTRHIPKPKDGEVLIEVDEVGVCGGDLHGFRKAFNVGATSRSEARIVGHEVVGTVVESHWSSLRPGTRVVVDPHLSCGSCEFCERGFQELCLNRRDMGNKGPAARTVDGVCAQYIVVPGHNCHVVPDTMVPDAAVCIHGLAAALHALERIPHRAAETVVVLGVGAAGLYLLQLEWKIFGAGRVIAVGRSKTRLQLAQGFGVETLNSAESNVTDEVHAMTEGRGADIVIDTTGDADVRRSAPDMCARAGTILFYAPGPITLDGAQICRNELTIYGSSGVTRAMKPAIDLVASGRIDTAALISHHFPLDQTQAAFELAISGNKGDYVKGAIVAKSS